jgi:hypothetical protein
MHVYLKAGRNEVKRPSFPKLKKSYNIRYNMLGVGCGVKKGYFGKLLQ